MSESINLSVVIPAFNEDQNLGIVIERAIDVLDVADIGSYELVIVDDGSVDQTGAVARRLAHQHTQVKAVHHARNRGFGAAVRSGYAAASGRYVTQIPADGEIEIGDVLTLFRAIGANDVMASHRERPTAHRRNVLTRFFHLLVRQILGFDGTDLDGIFVIRRQLLTEMTLRSDTGLTNLEVLMRCSQRRCRMAVGTVRAVPRLSGYSKVVNLPTMVRTLIEIVKLGIVVRREERR